MLCLHGKAKNKKKEFLEVASPSAWVAALGEEVFFLKKTNFFPECLGCGTRGRGFFLKKDKNLPRVLHSGKKNTRGRSFFKKNKFLHRVSEL
jgi:hypothetical protein